MAPGPLASTGGVSAVGGEGAEGSLIRSTIFAAASVGESPGWVFAPDASAESVPIPKRTQAGRRSLIVASMSILSVFRRLAIKT